MTESGQLRLPSCCGAVPAKSNVISSSCDGGRGTDHEVALGGLEHILRLETAVGQAVDRGSDDALRVVEELVHRRDDSVSAPALAQLGEAPGRQRVSGELGSKVASALVGVAHPGDEVVEQLVVEPRGWDHDPLVGQRARARGHAPRLDAADVCVVRAADREADVGPGDERDVG